MSERRYSDTEVAEIFRRATEEQARQQRTTAADAPRSTVATGGAGTGMTLSELEEIGREVGIPADLVARAATSLDRVGQTSVRRYLGLPIGVGRTVLLGRQLSDAQWERLVVDLRHTFDARGRVAEEGSLRQWTNGNLQALLEPTDEGARLRLKTVNGAAYMWMSTGLTTMAFAAFVAVARLLMAGGGLGGPGAVMMAMIGLGMFGLGAIRLPGWARRRARQMEEVAERLTASLPSVPPSLDRPELPR